MVARTFSKWMMKSTQRKWSFFFSLSFVIITNKILHFSSLTFVLIQFTLFHWSNYPMIDVYYKIKRKTKYLTWKRYRIIAALRKQIEFKTHANFWPNLTFVCFGALLFFIFSSILFNFTDPYGLRGVSCRARHWNLLLRRTHKLSVRTMILWFISFILYSPRFQVKQLITIRKSNNW